MHRVVLEFNGGNMSYKFPEIRTINDVLPHIKGCDEFIVAERDGFTVINYAVSMPDTFPPIAVAGGSAKMREERSLSSRIKRECRGLIFGEDGELMSRPFHKFFNINEREETLSKNIDMTRPHTVMEKMDGCLDEDSIIATPDGGKTIKFLCETNYNGLVLGQNLKKQIMWTPVLASAIKTQCDDWYEIELTNGHILKLTGNHKIWCTDISDYIRADELTGEEDLLFFEE